MKLLWKRSENSRMAFLTMLVLLLIWESAVRVFGIREFLLPPPSKIFTEFMAQPGFLLLQSLDTLQTTMAGFALAVLLGVGAAIGIGGSLVLLRSLGTLLFGVTPYDVPTYAIVVVLLGVVATPNSRPTCPRVAPRASSR